MDLVKGESLAVGAHSVFCLHFLLDDEVMRAPLALSPCHLPCFPQPWLEFLSPDHLLRVESHIDDLVFLSSPVLGTFHFPN